VKQAYKSRGEVQIARLLERNGIAYQYEHPVAVVDKGKIKIWYPDFWLSEYGMIIEYFGVNGDSGYDERTRHKIKVYGNNGIDGLFLKKDSLTGDWPTKILRGIEDNLKNRLDGFYNRRAANNY
jgi:hypothetical protein